MNRCYERELSRRNDRSFVGTIIVNIHVGASGTVLDVQVSENTLESDVVEECVVEVLESTALEPISTDYHHPFQFRFEPGW